MKILKIIIALLIILLCGCTQQQITNTADELTMYSWSNIDKYNKEITLSFKEDVATLSIKTPDYSGVVTGTAIINESSIIISDNTLKQNLTFDYVLYGNKIDLKYNESTIELRKISI